MSKRLDPSWQVVASHQIPEGDRCVDVFLRLDGTFGFEEFRRDPEDMGTWTPVAYFYQRVFTTAQEARSAAVASVPWFGQLVIELCTDADFVLRCRPKVENAVMRSVREPACLTGWGLRRCGAGAWELASTSDG